MSEEYEQHPGPLVQGDLIVIEINGKIIPRRPDDPRHQWFVVLNDQKGNEPVDLKPFNNATKLTKARLYRANWKF